MALALLLAEERAVVEFAAPAAIAAAVDTAAAAAPAGLSTEVTAPPLCLTRLSQGDEFVRKVNMNDRMGPRQLPVRRMVQNQHEQRLWLLPRTRWHRGFF